jgi:hypothetical protein
MKLKYIFGVALSALFIMGCSDDGPAGHYTDITLDQTFISIPVDGGDMTVTVKAANEWKLAGLYQKIVKNADGTRDTSYTPLPNSPAWLTVSQVSGSAGESRVTFHADATAGGREAEVCFEMNGMKQFLMVRQGVLLASDAKCSDVIAGPDGKNFRVTGKVTSIANTHYGNWYLDDGTGVVYIYGTNDKEGKAANDPIDGADGWKFEVGDVVTVEGPKTTYGSTVELVNVTVVKIVKSLLKLESTETEVDVNGANVEVKVAYKGSGAYFKIDDNAKTWVSISDTKYVPGIKTIFEQNPADTVLFSFNVAPNVGDSRTAKIEFMSSAFDEESKKTNSTTMDFTIKQQAFTLPHGKNPDDPFTVAEAIAKCQEIGGTSDGEIYYAKGKISSIKEISTSYGNGTFNISADGTDNNALTCYRSFFLDNQKFTDENQIAVGDEVIVCGKLVNYTDKNGVVTPEFSGNVYIYSLTKGSGAATEGADGSKIVTVADFIAAPESNDVWYQLTGTINNLKDGDAYGNFDLEDATGSVYVYGVLSEKGGAKKQFQDLVAAKGIKNGCKITIVGTRGSYNGKIEVMNAYFISVSN